MDIINFEKKKEMMPLTYDEKVYYESRKYCHTYAGKNFVTMKTKKKI